MRIPGIIDQNVEATVRVECGLDQCSDLIFLTYVDRLLTGTATGGVDVSDNAAAGLGVDIRHYDACTLTCKPLGDSLPEAGARTRYDHALVFKTLHCLPRTVAQPSILELLPDRYRRQIDSGYYHRRREEHSMADVAPADTDAGQISAAEDYPELLFRNYGMSKSASGTSYGMIILTAGSLGVMFGAWIANRLQASGYKDAYVRTIFFTALLAIVPAVYAPLSGSAQTTLIVLWPAVLLGGSYLGVMAVSFVVITPNQMRGQMTALYIFVTNILGMAVGTSVLAAFTDYVYQDDGLLHYSIATVNSLFYPAAALLFWYCLPAYRKSVEESGNWRV